MKTVLVAGGAGFIGSHLCEYLLENNYSVLCVDNLLTSQKVNVEHLMQNRDFSFIEHDVLIPLSPNDLNYLHVDFIFHLASPASPNHHSDMSYHALPMETMMVNTMGTLRLLELAEDQKARFLFASTSEIYGNPEVHPQTEDYNGSVSTTGPRSVYDESKRFGETLTAYFNRDKGLDTRIARIFNTYGPRMMIKDKRMIINFITQALEDKPLSLYGDGQQTRSLCYVDDLVEGLCKLMFTEELSGEIINLGSPEENTVKEYAEKVIALTQSKSVIEYAEDLPEDDPLQRQPDISKAGRLLHWKPDTSLEDGLSKTIAFFKTTSQTS